MAGGAGPGPQRPEAAQKQARPSCPSGAVGEHSLLGSQLALACPAGPGLGPRAPVGRRHGAAHQLQYQDPCAQTEKGTSQLALPGRQVHKVSAANMSCGRASRSRPHHNPPGHLPRGTTRVALPAWGLTRAVASGSVAGSIPGTGAVVPPGRSSGLPVGFLVRKQVSLEHWSVRSPEAGKVPHSNLFCLFRGFWSSDLPRG